MSEEHKGTYVCMTKTCTRRNLEVEHPWSQDWSLEQRRHKCSKCKKFMLFVKVRKIMSEEAKAKLRDLSARRRAEREET